MAAVITKSFCKTFLSVAYNKSDNDMISLSLHRNTSSSDFSNSSAVRNPPHA